MNDYDKLKIIADHVQRNFHNIDMYKEYLHVYDLRMNSLGVEKTEEWVNKQFIELRDDKINNVLDG